MIKKIFHKLLPTPKNAMSFRESLALAELPVVTFFQGDTKINFLLDTGSNNCIIDSNYLSNINYNMLDMESNLSGLEGNVQRTKVCSIKMSYKEKEYEYPYVIQNMGAAFGNIKKETGVTIHGLLGSNFFNDFKYILDFKELIAYSKQ